MTNTHYRNGVLREHARALGFVQCKGSNETRAEHGRCAVCGIPVKGSRHHGRAVDHAALKRDRGRPSWS